MILEPVVNNSLQFELRNKEKEVLDEKNSKRERIFAEDSVDEETGEMDKSYTIKVLPRATVKKYYPEYFAQKMFIAETTVNFAGSGKKVMLTLAY